MTHNQPSRLTGSQDLLTYFNIIPIYNKYVRPYSPPNRAAGLDPTLSSYIANLPGKNDMEPDGYLLNLLRDPQAVESGAAIRPLDAETLKEAFSLKEGPIPRFDASIFGTDDNGVAEKDAYGVPTGEGEKRHKKKKKKRKHNHEHEEDGHSHSEHKKKKKRKKEREHERGYRREENENETLVVD